VTAPGRQRRGFESPPFMRKLLQQARAVRGQPLVLPRPTFLKGAFLGVVALVPDRVDLPRQPVQGRGRFVTQAMLQHHGCALVAFFKSERRFLLRGTGGPIQISESTSNPASPDAVGRGVRTSRTRGVRKDRGRRSRTPAGRPVRRRQVPSSPRRRGLTKKIPPPREQGRDGNSWNVSVRATLTSILSRSGGGRRGR
jgi:hypothetical protein